MSFVEFEFEFTSEIPDPDDALRLEAEERLYALTEGHNDITGASVTMEEVTGQKTPHRYEARIVVYKRPNNVAATEKSDTAEGALKGALTAAERQVRELRNKMRETWKQP
jgi:ribosome-associated translation inhibitor RaiA